jgi:hypothetical protein
MGALLQQRRQPFDEQYRDADAEDHAQHAQQVVAELRAHGTAPRNSAPASAIGINRMKSPIVK